MQTQKKKIKEFMLKQSNVCTWSKWPQLKLKKRKDCFENNLNRYLDTDMTKIIKQAAIFFFVKSFFLIVKKKKPTEKL